jgi:hypothetical protein
MANGYLPSLDLSLFNELTLVIPNGFNRNELCGVDKEKETAFPTDPNPVSSALRAPFAYIILIGQRN